MLRFAVIAVTMACCSAFLAPPVPMQSSRRIEHNKVGVHMMVSSHTEDTLSGAPRRANTPTEPYSGQIDRRTLLKTVPATLAAGMIGLAAGAAPETALARATPKAAPSGTKVVVLGGNGFVGSKVCEMLVEAGEMEGRCCYGNNLIRLQGEV